ncbi:MAG: PEP-CTERM sorting domain-containing protein [Coleofasciculus sp. G3-WIS-01]|uniref:PEP-CTERM sorting domain-containing protein n=1 Tax=Coleofasciculus sp. G3-WIS-01 TaxID=3069528 RepID=UPI0033027D6A
MLRKHGLAENLLTIVTPVVAGLALTTSPTIAATLASSEARVNLDNFSHTPTEIFTLTDTRTNTIVTDGDVTADAEAEANFTADPFGTTEANNYSWSQAEGEGRRYLGVAESFAAIIGYDFIVDAGDTFDFDFMGFLDLETSIDNLPGEYATAEGMISLALYDSTNPGNWVLLDSFLLSGILDTLGESDTLDYQFSENFTSNLSRTSLDTDFGGQEELAKAVINGSYSKTFDSLTKLILIEAKTNQAQVQAVPESSSLLGLLVLGLLFLGYGFKQKGRV